MCSSSKLKLLFFVIRSAHLHTQTASSFSNPAPNDTVLNALYTSFRQGHSWDTITRHFPYLHLNDTSLQHLLLKFTAPSGAKPALSLFHWSAKRINDINNTNNTFQHSIRSYCITIHLLLKANFITDARALLRSLTARNIHSSAVHTVVDSLIDTCHDTHGVVSTFQSLAVNLLIQTYAKSKLTAVAFDVCRYVYERGYSLSVVSFNALLHAVQRSENCGFVWEVYEYMIRRRCYPNFATLRIMIDAICKQGELDKIVDTLDRIMNKRSFRNPCVVVNCGLMLRILNNRGDDALESERDVVILLKRLLQKNLLHEDVVYSMIVCARVVFGDLDSAWGLYMEMVRRGFGENAFVYNSFIGAFCRCGRVEEGISLLREMEGKGLKPYGETYEHVVLASSAVADSEHLEVCVSVFEEMVRVGFVPSCLVFNKVVERLCEKGEVVKANEILTVLLDRGFLPDDVTYFQLMQGYARKEEVQEVLKLYYEMEYRDVKKMNNLVTDHQMFALKTLQIPLPGRHPPSPCLSNGSNTPGYGTTVNSPPHLASSDLLESFQSLRIKSSDRKVSPAMSSLQGYYGLKGNSSPSEGGAFPRNSVKSGRPLNCHRKSRSLVNIIMEKSDDSPAAVTREVDSNKWNDKLGQRRQNQ